MKIGIIPKIISRYNNQLEISVEINLINFLKNIFKNSEIIILKENKIINLDLIIISGGNDLIKFCKNKENLLKFNLYKYYFKQHFSKTPIIGICHGAQFIASRFKNIIIRKKSSLKKHKLFLKNKSIYVNSFHNNHIKKVDNIFEIKGTTIDGFIEYFHSKKKKILAIMWHPEREIVKKKFDKNIFKKFYADSHSSFWKR